MDISKLEKLYIIDIKNGYPGVLINIDLLEFTLTSNVKFFNMDFADSIYELLSGAYIDSVKKKIVINVKTNDTDTAKNTYILRCLSIIFK